MAKCPKCERRKGKRSCPALETLICPTCCATLRLETIPCPSDCPHLESEYYQLGRRGERARSQGRRFLAALESTFFYSEGARRFAFLVHADIYWWMERHEPMANKAVAAALESVAGNLSRIQVPRGMVPPLGRFLGGLLARSRRYRELTEAGFDGPQKRTALETLAKYVRDHRGDGAGDEMSYRKEIAAYFDELDFEADLDYDPLEELDPETRQAVESTGPLRETRSGLILPREP